MRLIYLVFALLVSEIVVGQNELQTVASRVYSFDGDKKLNEENRASQRFFEGQTTHLSYFEMHSTTLAQDATPHPAHSHEDEEIVIVKEGKLEVTIDDEVQTLGPKSIALIQSGAMHGFKNVGSGNVTYYVMRYSSKAGKDMTRAKDSGGSKFVMHEQLPFAVHDKGGRRNYFDHPTSMCEDFEMHMTNLKPGLSSHAPHTHVVEEIILVTEGRVRMHIDGEEFDCKVGDVIFLDSMVPHAGTNIGEGQCQYFAYQWK